ncbi:MAG: hypothetical protein QG605_135, partial [Euryarchaeota archaeon]|nr:hypothetical protein [Euryarchaeota archaeon]
MDNKNNDGWKLKPHIKMFCKIAATMIIIYCMIGSIAVIAQEGQIIKEIKITTTVKNKDVTYKYDNPILLYPGNIIKLHCIVNPTLNYSIKKAYLNITRKDGGIDPISFPLRIKHNEKGDYIDDPIDWTLTKDVDLDGIYLAKIDLVTTNISTPDAGAYVSMKMSFSGVPIIIKFEDINPNGVFDEGTDRFLPGWKFIVEDPDGFKSTYETADDGMIQLDPVAVGGRYKQIEEEKTDNWISQPPPGMEDGGYTVQKENSGDENVLYFANNLKPATLQLVKYEDRNDNNIPDLDLGEGLPGRSFKVTGSGFSDVGVTNETGVAVIAGIPFLSVTGLPDDRPMQRYNITEGPMAGWRVLSPIVEELYPGDNSIVYIENVLLNGKVNVRKYEDINGNNRYDLDEGCPGWTITITGPGVDQTKNTDENGVASFDIGFKTDSARPNELPKNQYIIHEKPKDNWENVVDQSITLGPNEGKTVDIENTPLPGIIVVHKFEDKNDNGNPDAGEEGAGWTFRVQGKGVRNPTATTNESGMASFIVDFKSDAGSACQPQTQELIIHEVPKNCYEVQPDQQIELSPGKRQDRTFVNRIPPVTLAIQKFYDANKNAVLDPGEDDGEKYPLSGWQYEIAYQGNVQSLTTDRGGTTSITLPVSVPEAACTIREVTDRPGWICTTTNPRQIKISCENPTLKVEFGNKADRIVIKKFNDSNINSKQDDGEDGLPGWKFDIMSPDGSTTTIGPTN